MTLDTILTSTRKDLLYVAYKASRISEVGAHAAAGAGIYFAGKYGSKLVSNAVSSVFPKVPRISDKTANIIGLISVTAANIVWEGLIEPTSIYYNSSPLDIAKDIAVTTVFGLGAFVFDNRKDIYDFLKHRKKSQKSI